MRGWHGMTLLELIVSLSVLAILGALAVPSFTGLYHDNSRSAAVNQFLNAIFLARSEAMKRGKVITLCKSADGMACANQAPDWNMGWMLFVNADRDDPPVRDAGEAVIQLYPGWPGGHITSNRAAYSFRSYNQGVVNGTLVFCDPRGSSTARALIINHVGRPRLSQRDPENKPLRCPPG